MDSRSDDRRGLEENRNMTRRERLERKLEKGRTWAVSADAKASQAFDRARAATEGIPFGQPILVGHHSEGRHRSALKRSDAAMGRMVENMDKAKHHEQCARGIETALDRSIFSDDENAIEALEMRIAEREAEIERRKAINRAWIKGGTAAVAAQFDDETARSCAAILSGCPQDRAPYGTTNIRVNIRRDRERIKLIRVRADRSAKADATGGILIEGADYVRVTFAEKPERSVINALKDAGFRWGGGSWHGKREALPASIGKAVTS